MGLALDVGFAGLALGIERVEVLFEAMFGGFPGIDGTTQDFPLVSRHGGSPVSWPSARVSPSFLRTAPAKNPRTECCCHPVTSMIDAIVVPWGRLNSAITLTCLESAESRQTCSRASAGWWMPRRTWAGSPIGRAASSAPHPWLRRRVRLWHGWPKGPSW
jgi:hypothetical protein